MKRLVPWYLLAIVLCSSPVRATVVVPPTFDDLVDGAREIFIGEVVARYSQWIDTADGRGIVTLVTFKVVESLKGDLQTQTSLEFLGGTVGDATLIVPDMPQFAIGDRDVLFVGNRNAMSPLVGVMHGRFRIARDEVFGIDSVRTHDGRAFVSTASLRRSGGFQSPNGTLSLSAFRSEVMARLRGQSRRAQ